MHIFDPDSRFLRQFPGVSAKETRAAVNAAFEEMVLSGQHRRRVVCTGV